MPPAPGQVDVSAYLAGADRAATSVHIARSSLSSNSCRSKLTVECRIKQRKSLASYYEESLLHRKRFRLFQHISSWRGLSVCLSVVCNIRVPCLNRSPDLDVI